MKTKLFAAICLLGFSTIVLADAKLFLPGDTLIIINGSGAKTAGMMHVRLLDASDPKWDPNVTANTNCQALFSFQGVSGISGIQNGTEGHFTSCNDIYNNGSNFGISWAIATPPLEGGDTCPPNTVLIAINFSDSAVGGLAGGSVINCSSGPIPGLQLEKNVIPSGLVMINTEH